MPKNLKREQSQSLVELQKIAKYKRIRPLAFFERMKIQEAFALCASKVKILFGGNRSGKTEEGAEYVINFALNHPGAKIWACAETYGVSVSIQQAKIWKLLPKDMLKYAHYDEVNGFTNHKVIFNNGSSITFKTYEQGREAHASDDIDLIWNDEEPPFEIVKEQRMRLLDRNGEMIYTMTSLKGITELMEDIFDDYEIIKSQFAPLVGEELPRMAKKDNVMMFFMWTTENQYVNQDRVMQDVALMTKQEIKSRIYGMPVNLAGRVYPMFNQDIHVLPYDDLPFGQDFTLYHVLDPHDAKPWAMSWYIVDKTSTAYKIDEYPNTNFNEILYDEKDYQDYADIIRIKEEAIYSVFGCKCYRRIIDPNFGNKTIRKAEAQGEQSTTTPKKTLYKLGLNYVDGIDTIEAGHLKVRSMLTYKIYNDDMVISPKFYIADTCRNSIRHISRYAHKDPKTKDGDIKKKVPLTEKYKDFCDLDRYFWMSNPKYIDMSRKWEPPTDKVY